MRQLRIMEHVSLDGVMQHTPDGGDFPHAGWQARYRTPEGMRTVLAAYGSAFDLVLGRTTYDQWSEAWGRASSSPMADRINAATKFVATHHPDNLEWGPVDHLGSDVIAGVRRIKQTSGPDLVLSGSSTLAALLLSRGLVDELLLITYPLILGTGKRLFPDGIPSTSLTLTSSSTTPTGVVLCAYAVAP